MFQEKLFSEYMWCKLLMNVAILPTSGSACGEWLRFIMTEVLMSDNSSSKAVSDDLSCSITNERDKHWQQSRS